MLDNAGRPICCELWPGNASDAKALIPIADRLKGRFHIQRICVVAVPTSANVEPAHYLGGWVSEVAIGASPLSNGFRPCSYSHGTGVPTESLIGRGLGGR